MIMRVIILLIMNTVKIMTKYLTFNMTSYIE